MPNTFNLEPPKFNVAARFHGLIEEIWNQPQDPTVVHEAARAWLADGQLQLMWTIEDQLIAASKVPPVWLTDPDKRLRIYMFGLPPALAHCRDEIMSYLSCLMAGWGLDARIEEHPLAIQGQTTFQISIKFPTLPGNEAASYIPIVVGDYPRQHKYLPIPDKNPVTPRPNTIILHTPISLDDSVSIESHDSTSSPPIASGLGHDVPFSSGSRDCGSGHPPEIDIYHFMAEPRNVEHDAVASRDTNPLFDALHPVIPGARSIDGGVVSASPVHKSIDLPPSGASSVFEPEPDPNTSTQQVEKTTARNQEVRHPSPRRLYLDSRAWDGGIVEPIALKAIKPAIPEGSASLDCPNVASQDQSKFKRTFRGCKRFYVTLLLAFLALAGLTVVQAAVGIRVVV